LSLGVDLSLDLYAPAEVDQEAHLDPRNLEIVKKLFLK
jgi:hypothetical protein